MKTLIIRHGSLVRFVVTDHPEFRFRKIADLMPVEIQLMKVTSELAKDIRLRFAHRRLDDRSEWYQLDDEFESYIESL